MKVPAEQSGEIPRIIIALYNSESDEALRHSFTHVYAEMPLNHLGLMVEYHDIQEKKLPDIQNNPNIRGILSWLRAGDRMDDPEAFITWASRAIDAGKKLVILGDPGFFETKKGQALSLSSINLLMNRIGLRYSGEWEDLTYNVEIIYKNKHTYDFERTLAGGIKPEYSQMVPFSPLTQSHLIIRKYNNPESEAHLVTTHPNGGYVSWGYGVYTLFDDNVDIRQWYLNPFEFFRRAFATDDLPKPDTNTLSGRRIYYSHIDGDGWNNVTEIEEYKEKKILSSQVILEKILLPYSDLPTTVAPIGAELDANWSGSQESEKIAQAIFLLKHIEIGNHTYSHMLKWDFFEHNPDEKEQPLLRRYPDRGWDKNYLRQFYYILTNKDREAAVAIDPYKIPRAYASRKFDLDQEIKGAINYFNELAPPGKKTKIMQWSGNTTPYEEVIRAARLAGLSNINGGDTRLDREYPSYAWVAPIGRPVGNERQIYSSNSNENTYTDLWSGRFHGYRYLKHTLANTESPFRLKPFNVYYHMYSGEKLASLLALTENLETARSSEVVPVTTHQFAEIAQSFYSTRLIPDGTDRWRIANRHQLQTIRFDHATFKSVDFSRSRGVIGQRHHQGSLYVALDSQIEHPVIGVKYHADYFREPDASVPYLIQSRWQVWGLQGIMQNFSFTAQGFGTGDMTWKVSPDTLFTVTITKEEKTPPEIEEARSDHNGILNLSITLDAIDSVSIQIKSP
ncbi:MAG: hypothetical protein HQM12_07120 [SAR324 cluster bacterium]|nr:hypothetical protein [SAR324 cluster bacterium]